MAALHGTRWRSFVLVLTIVLAIPTVATASIDRTSHQLSLVTASRPLKGAALATGSVQVHLAGPVRNVRGVRYDLDGKDIATTTVRPFAVDVPVTTGRHALRAHVTLPATTVTVVAKFSSAGGGTASASGSSTAPTSTGSSATSTSSAPQHGGGVSGKVTGITLDDVADIAGIVAMLQSLPVRPTVRVVFDQGQPPSAYRAALQAIHPHAAIMGELLDSDAMAATSTQAYLDRANAYFAALGDLVDTWEVGNEVNGEWLGSTADVVAKVSGAFDLARQRNLRTELTLYYNPQCWEDQGHEMFAWARANIPQRMVTGLDQVLISYYEVDCNDFRPSSWSGVFDQVHQLFPSSDIGFGEVGLPKAATSSTLPKAQEILRYYYGLDVTTPRFVGGWFWWYGAEDLVPTGKPLLASLQEALRTSASTSTTITSGTAVGTPVATQSGTQRATTTTKPTTTTTTTAMPTTAVPRSFDDYPVGAWAEGSTHGAWRSVFNGFGWASVTNDPIDGPALSLVPHASTSTGETHAALAVTTTQGDLTISARAITDQQLRTGSAPNAWERDWLFWHYTDNVHAYYLVCKANGWELGKLDPAYAGAQRFLATGSNVTCPVGTWHTYLVHQVGNVITAAIDGTTVTTFRDVERPYPQGAVGLYTEDAAVRFADVAIS